MQAAGCAGGGPVVGRASRAALTRGCLLMEMLRQQTPAFSELVGEREVIETVRSIDRKLK